jgi:hypothetical protein
MLATPQRSYTLAGITGTVGAALAQDSVVFAMFASASADLWAYLEQIRLAYTTIVPFTTPVTAARRLTLHRATGGVPATGGTQVNVVKNKTGAPASIITDARIAAAVALGIAGITVLPDPIATLDLTSVGAAGGRLEQVYDMTPPKYSPHAIVPGELLVIKDPVAMDAAGTWQLAVAVRWREDLPGL